MASRQKSGRGESGDQRLPVSSGVFRSQSGWQQEEAQIDFNVPEAALQALGCRRDLPVLIHVSSNPERVKHFGFPGGLNK